MPTTVTYRGTTYANGQIPKAFLKPLDGENYDSPNDRAVLREDAARSWNAARAEVRRKTDVVLAVRGWNRTYQEQVTFYLQRHKKWTPSYRVCCYWNGVPYRFTGTAHAAPPGTSNHGWGIAVDVVDFGTVRQWDHPRRVASIAILKKHGWTDNEGRGSIQEPWHLVYDPARDTQKNVAPAVEADESRTFHTEWAIRPTQVRETPGGTVVRTLQLGDRASIIDGSGIKRDGWQHWWGETTSGNWVNLADMSEARPHHTREVTTETHPYDKQWPAGPRARCRHPLHRLGRLGREGRRRVVDRVHGGQLVPQH
jgi:hypothetical protein